MTRTNVPFVETVTKAKLSGYLGRQIITFQNPSRSSQLATVLLCQPRRLISSLATLTGKGSLLRETDEQPTTIEIKSAEHNNCKGFSINSSWQCVLFLSLLVLVL